MRSWPNSSTASSRATKLPNVRLGIIALDTVSPQVAPLHSFHIYDGELGTFGTESGTALPSDPQRVASFAELEQLALYDDGARSLLDRINQEYRSRTV